MYTDVLRRGGTKYWNISLVAGDHICLFLILKKKNCFNSPRAHDTVARTTKKQIVHRHTPVK